MIADKKNDKNLSPTVNELFLRERTLNISRVYHKLI